jgi:glycosyltransferase involved in cell wall biosynthesis
MILGVASVWDSRKGLNDFIRLRTILSKNLSIILVGLTKGQIKKLPEGIIGITQTTNQKQLAQLYSDAMAFVNPTYSDNFPTTNIEALGCGTPVITYRTGGSPEAVDETTGMVIEKGDVEGLASAILKVVNNPELYPPSACRKRAVERFNKETQFAKYINLYTDLVNRKN